jgi:hypothetical protein
VERKRRISPYGDTTNAPLAVTRLGADSPIGQGGGELAGVFEEDAFDPGGGGGGEVCLLVVDQQALGRASGARLRR